MNIVREPRLQVTVIHVRDVVVLAQLTTDEGIYEHYSYQDHVLINENRSQY